MCQESWWLCAFYQSVGDDEPDVLIIKEERPDNIRCEQTLGETQTAGNREYGGVLLFITYLRDNVYNHMSYYTCVLWNRFIKMSIVRRNVTINNSVVLSVVYCVFYFILIFKRKLLKCNKLLNVNSDLKWK